MFRARNIQARILPHYFQGLLSFAVCSLTAAKGFRRPRAHGRMQVMDHPLIDLINARIEAAEKDGAFDNLEGAGKPLPKCEDPENELVNRLVRESGGVPEFVSLSRELQRLRAELREAGDRSRRQEILKEMSMMDARIEIARKAYTK